LREVINLGAKGQQIYEHRKKQKNRKIALMKPVLLCCNNHIQACLNESNNCYQKLTFDQIINTSTFPHPPWGMLTCNL